jgi:hypothetical protein
MTPHHSACEIGGAAGQRLCHLSVYNPRIDELSPLNVSLPFDLRSCERQVSCQALVTPRPPLRKPMSAKSTRPRPRRYACR